jgi:hypothetical protein
MSPAEKKKIEDDLAYLLEMKGISPTHSLFFD